MADKARCSLSYFGFGKIGVTRPAFGESPGLYRRNPERDYANAFNVRVRHVPSPVHTWALPLIRRRTGMIMRIEPGHAPLFISGGD